MSAPGARGWLDRVDRMPSVSLEELNSTAAMLTRVDRKYVVSPQLWNELLGEIDGLRVLEEGGRRVHRYESTYFDTVDLQMYRDAARRRPRRTKVRTRRYVDAGVTAIEVKERSASGATVKSREWLDRLPDAVAGPAVSLPPQASEFVAGFPRLAPLVPGLRPTLTTAYDRVTFVGDHGRVTVDRNVTARDAAGREIRYDGALIVETKVARHAGDVDRALWATGMRPARVSKYCTSLAALQPELPSNRWNRTLHRHLDGALAPAS